MDCLTNDEKVLKILGIKKYIINKNATIVFWEDDTKTIVKRMKNEKHNKELAFLTALLQKILLKKGINKNRVNKFLENLIEEGEKK